VRANSPLQTEVTVETPINITHTTVYNYQMFVGGNDENQERAQKAFCHRQVDFATEMLNADEMYTSYLGIVEKGGMRYRRFTVQPKAGAEKDGCSFEAWDREQDETLYKIIPHVPAGLGTPR
jgi:hypothetical protein